MFSRLPSSAMFGALAGVVLFFLVFDPRLVDPGYWIWLMEGDPATQYLGWRFFRAEPWLWPPGMIRSYGLEVGSAIVFTDSIPIAAFAAKLMATGVNDATGDILQDATAFFSPVLSAMSNTSRHGAKSLEYTYRHDT